MLNFLFNTFTSPFEAFTIVWKEDGSKSRIQRVFLCDNNQKSEDKALKSYKNIKLGSHSQITSLGKKIQQFFKGVIVEFDLDWFDFKSCSEIQKKVLIAEYKIPRGWVSTYKRIALEIGIVNGARVVGNALAKNPFPIVIPCHRAIKSNGELGGYQGGVEMKQNLLEMEGLKFTSKGKVITNKVYY
jgi:methylated-DNA-[protein]-cysteine S-methyltransferase